MKQQETFDLVVSGLRAQGVKSQRPCGGICMYRGPRGTKCAAGLLIPDEKYDPIMEGSAVYVNAIGDDKVCLPGMKQTMHAVKEPTIDNIRKAGLVIQEEGHDLRLVRQLQEAHDQHEVCDWEACFEATAERFNLTYTPPA